MFTCYKNWVVIESHSESDLPTKANFWASTLLSKFRCCPSQNFRLTNMLDACDAEVVARCKRMMIDVSNVYNYVTRSYVPQATVGHTQLL